MGFSVTNKLEAVVFSTYKSFLSLEFIAVYPQILSVFVSWRMFNNIDIDVNVFSQ